jgi:hypothetical protein
MLKDSLRIDRKIKTFYEKHERLMVPGLLVSGFIFDVITFRTLSITSTMQFLGVYAVLAALALMYSSIYDGREALPRWTFFRYLRAVCPYVIQLTFGALLSSALLFYWFSGSFSVSWPLIALVTGVMISSEIFRQVYLKPGVLLGVYSFLLLSYFTLLLPFVLNSLKAWIFLVASALSLGISILIIFLVSRFSPTFDRTRWQLTLAVIGVLAFMNALYFANLIPPVPLSVREAGVYHDIVRTKNDFQLVGEEESFWENLWPGQTVHAGANDSIYVYTAIFAPTDLSTTIYHRWEYKDPATGKWAQRSLLHFNIRGGRDEGFRGYTMKSSLFPGKWRVTVENGRGQVLGRIPFTVVSP